MKILANFQICISVPFILAKISIIDHWYGSKYAFK